MNLLSSHSSIVCYFLQLPVEINRSIFNEYLKGKSKYTLLQTTRKLNQLRKQIIYIKLNAIKSEQFYLNNSYRERLLSCIESPLYQLHLVFDKYSYDEDWLTSIDLSVILPIHKLEINCFSKIDNFHLIETYKPNVLDICDCDSSIDIELCKGISKLVLSYCSKIENIDKFSHINICRLHSCSVNPMEWSVFSSLQVFELSDCDSITDVSALAHIPDLTLSQCPNITNIDVLTHNKKLTIYDCEGIEKISLSDHPRDEVCIKGISEPLEVTIAGKVRNVTLTFLSSVLQLSLLDYVNELTIKYSEVYLNSKNMQFVQSLTFITCNQLIELPPSLQIKSLEIKNCDSLTSIRSLQFLESLTIISASELQLIEDLPLLTKLKINKCEKLTKLINLPICKDYSLSINELELVNCPGYLK